MKIYRNAKLKIVSIGVFFLLQFNLAPAHATCFLHTSGPEQVCDLAFYIRNGNLGGVKRAVTHGVSVNAKDDRDVPMLILALFLPKSSESIQPIVAEKNKVLNSIVRNKIEIANYLVQKGADVNAEAKGLTPLHFVAMDSRLASLTEPFLKRGANINKAGGAYKITPLLAAVESNNIEAFDFLIKGGADVNQQMSAGISPLLAAVQANNIEMVPRLIKAGAHLDLSNDGGLNPLEQAVIDGKPTLVRLLLEAGANADIRHSERSMSARQLAETSSSEVKNLFLNYPQVKEK